jgi:hypothetical protein
MESSVSAINITGKTIVEIKRSLLTIDKFRKKA